MPLSHEVHPGCRCSGTRISIRLAKDVGASQNTLWPAVLKKGTIVVSRTSDLGPYKLGCSFPPPSDRHPYQSRSPLAHPCLSIVPYWFHNPAIIRLRHSCANVDRHHRSSCFWFFNAETFEKTRQGRLSSCNSTCCRPLISRIPHENDVLIEACQFPRHFR